MRIHGSRCGRVVKPVTGEVASRVTAVVDSSGPDITGTVRSAPGVGPVLAGVFKADRGPESLSAPTPRPARTLQSRPVVLDFPEELSSVGLSVNVDDRVVAGAVELGVARVQRRP